ITSRIGPERDRLARHFLQYSGSRDEKTPPSTPGESPPPRGDGIAHLSLRETSLSRWTITPSPRPRVPARGLFLSPAPACIQRLKGRASTVPGREAQRRKQCRSAG